MSKNIRELFLKKLKSINISRNICKILGGSICFVVFMLFTLSSCSNGLNDSDDSRKMTGGTIPINIYLYYTPKTITYKPDGSTEVTDAYQAGVWAWQCISSGDKNYTTADWPGDFAMIPYDKSGNALDTYKDSNGVNQKNPVDKTKLNDNDPENPGHKLYEKVAYWKFTLKITTQNDLGILFVDAHTKEKAGEGDQYKWDQTNDIRVPKEKLKKGANLYFIYKKVAYYESFEESQGLKSAVINDEKGSDIDVTFYNNDKTLTKDDFIVTDRDALIDENGDIKDDENGQPTGVAILIKSIENVTQTGLTIKTAPTTTRMPYKVYYKEKVSAEGEPDEFIIHGPVYAFVTPDVIDSTEVTFDNTGSDKLGVTLNDDGTCTFRTWAPTAKSVSLLLFRGAVSCGTKGQNINKWEKLPVEAPNDNIRIIAMERSNIAISGQATSKWDGTWVLENESIPSGFDYYKYRLTFSDKNLTADEKMELGELKVPDNQKYKWVNTIECKRFIGEVITFDVADIWAKVSSPDGVASQIISINDPSAKPSDWSDDYYNPFTKTAGVTRPYSDAVIYEMDIADFASNCTGKYDVLSDGAIIEHLKDLGVTHVALMPVMENTYTMEDTRYNWGFCTYNFNVPESRYARNMSDGVDSVRQLRLFIQKLHDAGIAVIMDVAFTHTGNNKCSTGSQSLYDSTVPEYFYRMQEGVYSNGANQGSEIATNHKMVKEYIIDCLKHWMTDYHVNGFSFYLMGLHEKDTMKDIYNALYEVDQNVIVMGEPWTGGRANLTVDGVNSAISTDNGNGVAVLDENYRTAIKGVELRGFTRGAVQGNNNSNNDNALIRGLLNKYQADNTDVNNIGIHYAEIHDDNTLFDKLLLSMSNEAGRGSYKENTVPLFADLYNDLDKYIDDIRKEDKLAAAYVILAQGTPFISAAQEFLRTKHGNPDSVEAGRRREHTWLEEDLVKCNEQDFNLRDKYDDVFSVYRGLIALKKDYPSDFGNSSTATAQAVSTGVIKYDVDNFVVYFNATASNYSVNIDGYTVDIGGGFNETGYDSFMGHTYNNSITPYTIASNKTTVTKVPSKSFVIIKK